MLARLFKYGHASLAETRPRALNGCYASHIPCSARHACRRRAGRTLPDAAVAPANCALATMAAATEQLPRPCRVAVIQGAGLLGIYGCALLRARGVPRVVVVDTEPGRLELAAARFGGEPALSSALESVGAGEADLVIEAAGNGLPWSGEAACGSASSWRTLCFRPGMVHPDSALALTGEAIIRGCLTLRGIHNYGPRHLDAALDFLAQNLSLPWASLVSPPLPLAKLDEAFALTATKQWARVAVSA